jgi:hypothetical protein
LQYRRITVLAIHGVLKTRLRFIHARESLQPKQA